MLEQISIKNYRCFESFHADNFNQVNLIGGKNNSGKTVFLEAIYSAFYKGCQVDIDKALRDENHIDASKANIKNDIEFKIKFNGLLAEKIIERTDFSVFLNKQIFNGIVHFIGQRTEMPKLNIINSFDNIQINKLDLELVEILKVVDENITGLRSYSSKGIVLYVQTQNNVDLPISSFGDATYNLIRYFTPIFEKIANNNNESSILLIDEIENGLHFTVLEEFWNILFRLAEKNNVQIFATTHSIEMIKAFNVISKKYEFGSYFEMLRNKSNIKMQFHENNVLELELQTHEPFRGE